MLDQTQLFVSFNMKLQTKKTKGIKEFLPQKITPNSIVLHKGEKSG